MLELAKQLTASGDYTAAVVSMETGAAFPDDQQKWQFWTLELCVGATTPCRVVTAPVGNKTMGSQIAAASSLWQDFSPPTCFAAG